jgi:hypothetical protein
MSTVYSVNYQTGCDDKTNGGKCHLPSTLPDTHAFRGYMDGYSGREFNEPKGMQVEFKFKETIK